jgi:peptidoglycan-N-acetylglucosamine deacetylase
MKAALSIDLDNKWSYMKTHGDAGWEQYPSYMETLVPRVLDLADRLGLSMTFFIVGRDAALPGAARAFAPIPERGHEVGNHSYLHEPWICKNDERAVDEELARAEDAIHAATGAMPIGFRAPGFARSEAILRVLAARSYAYDASSLPTFIGPIARAYYLRGSRLGDEERKRRDGLFGGWRDGLRPNRPHALPAGGRHLIEIPVTTFPLLRTPIHLSYVLYLAMISPRLAMIYFDAALHACRLAGIVPSILLHPLDFLSAADAPELAFFPAMSLDPKVKAAVVREALEHLAGLFEVHPLRDIAQDLSLGARAVVPQAAGSRT